MEAKKLISCFYFKYTGKCPLNSSCPDILGHKRCLAFLYGDCLIDNCAFYHDLKGKAALTNEDFCKSFKATGSCDLNESCKFSFFHKNCRHFLKGNCAKGANCPFYHNKATEVSKPKETREICKHFLAGTCKYGEKCFKLHQKQEQSQLGGANSAKKEKLCQEFVKGTCPRGKSCPMVHVCRHFLKGFCKLGVKCTFPHIDVKEKSESFVKTDFGLESESDSLSSYGGETIKDESICCICLDSPSTHATAPCGHLIYCEKCVKALRFCAMCRKPIQSFIRIYK